MTSALIKNKPYRPLLASALKRHRTLHTKVFAGWALASLLLGCTGMFLTAGRWHHFHHMNAAWGSINLTIAGVLWYQTRRLSLSLTESATAAKERRFRRFLRINVGLDIGYALVGCGLYRWGAESAALQPLLQGFGLAVGVQGLVLLSLDATSLRISNGRRKRTQRS